MPWGDRGRKERKERGVGGGHNSEGGIRSGLEGSKDKATENGYRKEEKV